MGNIPVVGFRGKYETISVSLSITNINFRFLAILNSTFNLKKLEALKATRKHYLNST